MSKRHEKELRLRAVWEHGTPLGEQRDLTPWRYVARAYSGKGPGWGVFDKAENRFVDEELIALSVEALSSEQMPRLQ